MSKGKNEEFNDLGNFLRAQRGKRSQDDISKLARLSVPYVSQLESGFLMNRRYNERLKKLTGEIEALTRRAEKSTKRKLKSTTVPETQETTDPVKFVDAMNELNFDSELDMIDGLLDLEKEFGNAEFGFDLESSIPEVFLDLPEETLRALAYAYETTVDTLRFYTQKGNSRAHEALVRECRALVGKGDETTENSGFSDQKTGLAPNAKEDETEFLLRRGFDADEKKMMELSVNDLIYIREALNNPGTLRTVLSSLGLKNYAETVGKSKGVIESKLSEISMKLRV